MQLISSIKMISFLSKPIFIIFALLFISANSYCGYNPSCSSRCLGGTCYYDSGNIWNMDKCCNGCQKGYYYFSSTMSCYEFTGNCGKDNQQNQLFWNYQTNTCNLTCLDGFKNYNTNLCVFTCPQNMLTDIQANKCTEKCSMGYFDPNNNSTNVSRICTSTCPSSTFMDLVNNKCVLINECPFDSILSIQLYSNNFTLSCTARCPSGTYSHAIIKTCVRRCFSPYPYTNNLLNSCDELPDGEVLVYKLEVQYKKQDLSKLITKPSFLLTLVALGLSIIAVAVLCIGLLYYRCYVREILSEITQRKRWTIANANINAAKQNSTNIQKNQSGSFEQMYQGKTNNEIVEMELNKGKQNKQLSIQINHSNNQYQDQPIICYQNAYFPQITNKSASLPPLFSNNLVNVTSQNLFPTQNKQNNGIIMMDDIRIQEIDFNKQRQINQNDDTAEQVRNKLK